MSNSKITSSELLKLAAEQYGTKSKDEEKKTMSSTGTKCSENSGYVKYKS